LKLRFALALAAFASITASACSTTVATPAAPTMDTATTSSARGGSREQTITVRAVVQSVDQKTRHVTVKAFDGTTETLALGEEVRNLPQLKKGDEVVVTYHQAVAFEVLKKGDKRPVATVTEGVGRAKEGDKPGAAGGSVVTVVADILKLDREHSTATLRGPKGNVYDITVQDPENFNKVKVGEKVEITLTEAVAIDVQAPTRP
jgi:hypothetical protein